MLPLSQQQKKLLEFHLVRGPPGDPLDDAMELRVELGLELRVEVRRDLGDVRRPLRRRPVARGDLAGVRV